MDALRCWGRFVRARARVSRFRPFRLRSSISRLSHPLIPCRAGKPFKRAASSFFIGQALALTHGTQGKHGVKLVRFHQCLFVTDAQGDCRKAAQWVPKAGHLQGISYEVLFWLNVVQA
jgi:hypothetical protein